MGSIEGGKPARFLNKKDLLFILIIILAGVAFYFRYLSSRLSGDGYGLWNNVAIMIRQSALEYHVLPLWTHLFSGGMPLIANPEIPFMSLANLLFVLIKDPNVAVNVVAVFHMVLGAIGIYLLVKLLEASSESSLVAGLIYMFSGFLTNRALGSGLPQLLPAAFIPFVMIFVVKCQKSRTIKELVFCSVLAGLFMSMILLSGGFQLFLWCALLVGLYVGLDFLFKVFKSRNPVNAIMSLVVFGLVFSAVCVGISAVKLIPGFEFTAGTSRAGAVSYDDFLWKYSLTPQSEILKAIPLGSSTDNFLKIGVVGSLLALAGLLSIKKQRIMVTALILIISLLIMADTFITHFIYSIPFFNKARVVMYCSIITAVTLAILAGRGASFILEKVGRVKYILFALFVALIIADQLFFTFKPLPKMELDRELKETYALQAISKESGIFRVHYAGFDFVASGGGYYFTQLGLEPMEWTSGNIWLPSYTLFTQYAGENKDISSKMWGMLNVKYVLGNSELNISGLKFVKKYDNCSNCASNYPYLYENEQFIDRAFTAKNSVLVIGDESSQNSVVYGSMIGMPAFDPKSTVILTANSIKDIPRDALMRVNLIVLLKSPSSDESQLLTMYAKGGGKILPDITNGKVQTSPDEIMAALGNFSRAYSPASISLYTPNKITINVESPGFLVISEKLASFPGWKASLDGQNKGIMVADVVNSVVYLDKPGKLELTYLPGSFVTGVVISIIALVASLSVLIAFRKSVV